MRMFLRMKCENFVLAAEIPCEWKFATKFASDCECGGVVHSAGEGGPSEGQLGRDPHLGALDMTRRALETLCPERVFEAA